MGRRVEDAPLMGESSNAAAEEAVVGGGDVPTCMPALELETRRVGITEMARGEGK